MHLGIVGDLGSGAIGIDVVLNPTREKVLFTVWDTGIGIAADKVGSLEQFKNRTVQFKDRSGKQRVRIISKLVWLAEDGGSKGWVKHTYPEYSLAQSSGLIPSFDAMYPTKTGFAPNTYTFD